jgi:hypothetical protein
VSAETINTQFILAEDEALHGKLKTLSLPNVRDPGGVENVGVWYRWPSPEFSEDPFPFVTLDMVDIVPERERMHSYNWDVMDYLPDAVPDAATPQEYYAPFPIPMQIQYVVATYTRNARHDRMLLRRLMQWDMLPPRFGYLDVEVDNTRRRLDIIDGPTEATYQDDKQKRVFRRVFTIGISAEMLPEEAYQAKKVQKVVFETVLHFPLQLGSPASPVY